MLILVSHSIINLVLTYPVGPSSKVRPGCSSSPDSEEQSYSMIDPSDIVLVSNLTVCVPIVIVPSRWGRLGDEGEPSISVLPFAYVWCRPPKYSDCVLESSQIIDNSNVSLVAFLGIQSSSKVLWRSSEIWLQILSNKEFKCSWLRIPRNRLHWIFRSQQAWISPAALATPFALCGLEFLPLADDLWILQEIAQIGCRWTTTLHMYNSWGCNYSFLSIYGGSILVFLRTPICSCEIAAS